MLNGGASPPWRYFMGAKEIVVLVIVGIFAAAAAGALIYINSPEKKEPDTKK
jgi:hypothetical protein